MNSNEDTDWKIYHIIAGKNEGLNSDELVNKSCLDIDTVEQSVERLTKLLLVTCRNGIYRACSIDEFILSSQIKQDPFLGLDIENGVIKVKKQAD